MRLEYELKRTPGIPDAPALHRSPVRPRGAPRQARCARACSFVSRCVRSWIARRRLGNRFLVTWTPLRLPEPFFGGAAHPDPSRRRPSSARRSARRAAQHPAQPRATAAMLGPVAAAGGADALRARYPLVSALLVELAAPRRRRTTIDRSLQR
jgi:hypothetical protein